MRRLAGLLALLLFAACGAGLVEPRQVRLDGGEPVLIRFDKATLDEPGTTLRLDFIGGRDFDPEDPCSTDYAASGEVVGDVLQVGIVQLIHPRLQDGTLAGTEVACDAAGHPRTAFVALDVPFRGTIVRDLAGYTHFLRAPEGLVQAPALPAAWELRSERSVEESPTGRWHRTWSTLPDPPQGTSRGKVELYQAFDGPVMVSSGDEARPVEVNGTPATLFDAPPGEERVLVWSLASDELALIVHAGDFTAAELLDLAESVESAP